MSLPADVLSGIDPQTGLGLAAGITPTISGARVDEATKSTWNYTLAGGSPMSATQHSVAANISKKSLGIHHSYAPTLFVVAIDTTAQTMVVVLHDSVPIPPSPADKGGVATFDDQSIIDKLIEKLTFVRDSYLPSAGIPFLYQRNGDMFDMRIPDASVADLNPGEFAGIVDFLDSVVSTDLSIPAENVVNVGSDVVGQDDDIVITSPVDDVISRVQNGSFKVFVNVPVSGMLRAGVALTNSDPSVATVVYEESTRCIVVTPASKGTTTISYTLSSTGTGASATDSFDITMTGQPIVTLVGAATISVSQDGSYTDQGATADGGEAVTVSGDTVDPATIGVYTTTYTATNSFGDEVATRVVSVVDTVEPVITVVGDNPLVLQQFDNFVDPGATAVDNGQDVAVVTSGSVDTAVADTYTLTYTATDAFGNTATATRPVEVQPDVTPPVITVVGDNPLVLQQFDSFVDPGATAVDNGLDVAVVTTGSVDTAVADTYTLTYTATDRAGNTATATRPVEVQPDVIPPVITVTGDNPMVLQQFDSFTDPGATAVDNGLDVAVVTTGSVDTAVADTYTLTYTATDRAGNTATATRPVEVQPDVTLPIITVTGDNPMVLQQFDSFVDPGATATDDGQPIAVVTTGSVDTAVADTYTLTYTATDAAGNTATATRPVEVQPDVTLPIITVTGDNPMVLQQFDSFVDPGATATDDGQPIAVVTTGSVDTAVADTYTLTYTATDAAGNTATATRPVEVQPDVTLPIITVTGDNPMVLQQFDSFTDPGATATDDGQPIAVVTTGSVDTAVAATYTLTYTATDAAGNTATATRPVEVQPDVTLPVITVTGDNPMVLQQFDSFTDPGATATDNGQPIAVVTTGSVDTAVADTYTLTYTATDAAGNTTTATRPVEVQPDVTLPVITVTGDNPMVLQQFDSFTDPGATATDNGQPIAVVTTGSVDTDVADTYTLTYTATDAAGNTATATRPVEVQPPDVTPPVITVTGDNPMVLQQFDSFIDPGATATDNGQPIAVVTTGSVDTAVADTYTLTYTATDAAGNTTTATRPVEVQPDVTPPTITLLGDNPVTHVINTPYTDAGVAVADGTLTNTDNPVDVATAASYTVTYTAEDAAGNQATATRTVTVAAGPVITLNGDNPLTWERYASFVNPGAVADGGETITEDTSNLTVGVVGEYDIVYSATNAGGTSYKVREVTINDTTPPTINLSGSNPQTVTQDGTYVESGATTDGGEAVTIDSTAVDTAVIGSYSVTYTATDDQGNQGTATRTVNVEAGDPNAPQGGSLVGGNPLTIERFSAWADVDPGSNDATDPTNGNAVVTATVDFSLLDADVVGTYNVTYTWTGSGGLTSTLVRSVVVEDTTAPYIALLGDNPMNVAQGSTFEDPGAYADTGETVSATGTVDTSVIGTYTLTYNATDSSGNQGVATTRTVNVVAETTDETSGSDTWRAYNTVTTNPGGRFYFDPNWIRNVLSAAGSSAYVEAGILNNDTGTLADNGFLLYARVSTSTTSITWHEADGTQIGTEIYAGYVETLMDVFASGAQTGLFKGSDLGSDPLSYEASSTIKVSPNTQSPTDIFKFGIKVENIGSFDIDLIDPENNVQTGPGRYTWDTNKVGNINNSTGQIYFRVDDAEDSSTGTYNLPLGNGGTSGAPPGATVWLSSGVSRIRLLALDYNTSTNLTDIQWTLVKQASPSAPWEVLTHFPVNTTDDLSVNANSSIFLTRSSFFSDAYRLRFYPRDIAGTVVPSGYTKGVNSGYALDIMVRHGAPTLTMNGEPLIYLDVGDTFNDPGATATDSATVQTTGTVDTSTAGEYSVVYTALHPIGREEATATRTVYVLDPSDPPPSWPALTAFDHGLYAGRTSSSYQTYLTIGDMAGGDAGTFGLMTYGNNKGTTWAWSQAVPGSTLNVPTELFNDAAGTQRSSQMYLTGSGVTWTTNFSNAVGTSNPYTLYSGGVSILTDGDTVQGTHNGRTLTFRFTSLPTTIFNWPLTNRRFEYTFPSMQVGKYINVGTPTAIFEFGGKAGTYYYKVKYDGVEYAFSSRGMNFPVPQGYQVRLMTSNSLAYFNGTSGLQDYTNTAIASASVGDLNTIAYYNNGSVNLTFYTI